MHVLRRAWGDLDRCVRAEDSGAANLKQEQHSIRSVCKQIDIREYAGSPFSDWGEFNVNVALPNATACDASPVCTPPACDMYGACTRYVFSCAATRVSRRESHEAALGRSGAAWCRS